MQIESMGFDVNEELVLAEDFSVEYLNKAGIHLPQSNSLKYTTKIAFAKIVKLPDGEEEFESKGVKFKKNDIMMYMKVNAILMIDGSATPTGNDLLMLKKDSLLGKVNITEASGDGTNNRKATITADALNDLLI